jgi:hypothetical protein
MRLKRAPDKADPDVAALVVMALVRGAVDLDRGEAGQDFKTPRQTRLRHNSSSKIKVKH